MSTPQSTIYICSGVRLNSRYDHTIYWSSTSARNQYFAGKVVKSLSAYTYIRKSWTLKVEATLEQARTWNYLYFTNDASRYWFYFIENVEYINDNTVELTLELDVMQTYALDYTPRRCFVERQHVSDDTIGVNVTDENLELGELVTNAVKEPSLASLCILIYSTIALDPSNFNAENPKRILSANYGGVFSGMGVYAVPATKWEALGASLDLLDENGHSDAIINIVMYPQSLVTLASGYSFSDDYIFHPVSKSTSLYMEVDRPATVNGYTPRNNKLLTYPYSMLYVTNNLGESAVYRYERFGDPTACNFRIAGTVTGDNAVRLYPLNYNGEQHNAENGLTLGNFPTCAWNQDAYKLWLAQNQNQHRYSNATSAVLIAGGVGAIATGNVIAGVGAIGGGIAQITSHLAQKADMAIQPPHSKGAQSSSVNINIGAQIFTAKKKSVTAAQARIIDDFFDIYGYKINRQKTPVRNARENWTYVKTIGSNVTGNFCDEDIRKINEIFDKGITFWKNGDSIGDYSLSNKPA